MCTRDMGSMGDCGECESAVGDEGEAELGAILRPPTLSDDFVLAVSGTGGAVSTVSMLSIRGQRQGSGGSLLATSWAKREACTRLTRR